MIVDTIVGFLTTIISGVFDVLPTWSIVDALGLPSVGSHDGASPGTVAGAYVGGFDAFLPLHEAAAIIVIALTAMLAFYAIYKLANWLWRHIPDIGGFGPGAG